MKKSLHIICFMLTIFSCSLVTMKKNETSAINNTNQDWKYLLDIQNEKWSKDKIIYMLGNPAEVFNDVKSKREYLIYKDKNTNHQTWSIGIKGEQIVTIGFFPNFSNKDNFSIDQISKYWGNNCTKKTDIDSSQPFVLKKNYLDCGLGRKARINNLGQIEGLFIEL
jgi:hypothetical protein